MPCKQIQIPADRLIRSRRSLLLHEITGKDLRLFVNTLHLSHCMADEHVPKLIAPHTADEEIPLSHQISCQTLYLSGLDGERHDLRISLGNHIAGDT